MVAPLRDLLREDGQDYANQARLISELQAMADEPLFGEPSWPGRRT